MRTLLWGTNLCLAVASVSFLSACTSSKQATPQAPPPASEPATVPSTGQTVKPPQSWHGKMHSLSQTLSQLMPLVASRAKFNNPDNAAKIEAETMRLRTLAHSLKTGEAPNADPSMRIMSRLFEEDIDRALESMRSGNREYSRQVLNDASSYCIQCHTQTSNGPDFPRLNLDINTAELPTLERAEFFAATRQFDRALEAYSTALGSEQLAKSQPFEWEQAARSALAITVRVKNNAKDTELFLAKIPTFASLPKSTTDSVNAWRVAAKLWAKQKTLPLKNPNDLLKRAEQVIQGAQKRQKFPLDHSQDIAFFRASSLLHDFLGRGGKDAALNARALYLSGVAAEATRDMNFWTLHESFYEQCVRTLPRSKQAEACFSRLKESVTMGYSGSGGVRIPPEVSRRLESFQALAFPEAKAEAAPAAAPAATPGAAP